MRCAAQARAAPSMTRAHAQNPTEEDKKSGSVLMFVQPTSARVASTAPAERPRVASTLLVVVEVQRVLEELDRMFMQVLTPGATAARFSSGGCAGQRALAATVDLLGGGGGGSARAAGGAVEPEGVDDALLAGGATSLVGGCGAEHVARADVRARCVRPCSAVGSCSCRCASRCVCVCCMCS